MINVVLPMLFIVVAGLFSVVKTRGIPSYKFAVDKHLLSWDMRQSIMPVLTPFDLAPQKNIQCIERDHLPPLQVQTWRLEGINGFLMILASLQILSATPYCPQDICMFQKQ